MGIGTFGSFTQARLAIYAAQTGLTVTGNNISNINTEGYTRQRLNQVSLYAAERDEPEALPGYPLPGGQRPGRLSGRTAGRAEQHRLHSG